jgi:hypothetical protein
MISINSITQSTNCIKRRSSINEKKLLLKNRIQEMKMRVMDRNKRFHEDDTTTTTTTINITSNKRKSITTTNSFNSSDTSSGIIGDDFDSDKYSLICGTPLTNTNKLKFKWFKNEQELNSSDEFEMKLNNVKNVSELVFKHVNKNEDAVYKCSLIFDDLEYHAITNKTFVVHFKCKPVFKNKRIL